MELGPLLVQLATPAAVLIGLAGLLHTVRAVKRQSHTQIFLEYTARYEKIMEAFPSDALSARLDFRNTLPESSEQLSLAVLRYLNMCSEEYHLWRKGYLATDVWRIWESELRRTLCSPLFRREWDRLKREFVVYPDFLSYVHRVHSDS